MAKGIWSRALPLLALLVVGAAHGEQIYRCDTENGVVYQDFPCDGSGEVIELPTAPQDPQEVERLRRRQAEMRALIDEATRERRRQEAMEALKAPSVVIVQPTTDQEERNKDSNDVRILDRCPLGLGNCSKPAGPVFRSPGTDRQTPLAPLGLSRGRGTATQEATE